MNFNKIMVIDDLLPKNYANHIEKTVFSQAYEWTFLDNINATKKLTQQSEVLPEHNEGFYNSSFEQKANAPIQNENFHTFKIIYYTALYKLNVDIEPVVKRCRSFLLLPNSLKTQEWDIPHVDGHNPHYVFLYYVNDSDGPTCIFNNNSVQSKSNMVVPQKIQPKKNRLLIFNGNMYHASTPPKLGKRAVINFNFEIFDWPLNMNKEYVI